MRYSRTGVLYWVIGGLLAVSLGADRGATGADTAPNHDAAVPDSSETDGEKLAFDTYSGYFVSNRFEPKAAASFVVLHDQEQFDNVFGAAFVMNDSAHRLPKDAFKKLMVVAAIRRGPAVVEYAVESVSLRDGVLRLRYTASAKPSPTATFACPLIVSIPKGDYRAVEFVENRKLVKRLELGKKP